MAQVTIYPSDDSYAGQSSPTTIYGAYADIVVRYSTGAVNNRGFLKFSTATVPTGAVISSAVLYLDVTTAAPNNDIQTHVCDADWAEGTLNWNNMPSESGSDLHTWSFASTGWVNSGSDLTATFNSWHTGAANNYGIRLAEVTTSGYATAVDSKETATPANKPYFLVTYTLPVSGGAFLLNMI